MRYIIAFAFLLFSALNVSAQIPPEGQNTTAANPASESPKVAEETPPTSSDEVAKGPDPSTEKHETDDAKGDSKLNHNRTSFFSISDWIAIGLGSAALIISMCGLRQNRISNEKQNRAYVTVDTCRVRATDNGMEAVVVLKNVGATPANDISLTHWFGAASDYNARLPRDGNIAMVAIDGNFFLGPSDKKTMLVKMEGPNMPPRIILKLLTGAWGLLLDGEMTYTDEFGKKHRLLYHFKRKVQSDGFFGEMNFADEGLQTLSV